MRKHPRTIGHILEAMLEWKAEQDLQDISKDVKRGLSDLVGSRVRSVLGGPPNPCWCVLEAIVC